MIKGKLSAEVIHILVAKAILDAPLWTDADRESYLHCQSMRRDRPNENWSALHGVPRDTIRAILKVGIESGRVPILGGIGGFCWRDLLALGYAKRSAKCDWDGNVDSIAFCYTGPGYLNVDGTFTSAGKWFDEGGACNDDDNFVFERIREKEKPR